MSVRSAKALAHLETMRENYVAIVRERLANPDIKDHQKFAFYTIAKRLTALGHTAPKGGEITYKIARRLSELVGDVSPPPVLIAKPATALAVGDRVRVISPDRSFHGSKGVVREVLDNGTAFNVAIEYRLQGGVLKFVLAHELRHLPG